MFNEDRIKEYFKIKKGDIISLTGGGGKTSLMFFLGKRLSESGKVLLTTTTKIYIPDSKEYEKLILTENKEQIHGMSKNIDILGSKFDEVKEKLIGISDEELSIIRKNYDYIIIESDGSSGKSIKAWNQNDPVISKYSTKIIGVTNINSLNKKVSEEVHRWELFSEKYKIFLEELVTIKFMINYLKVGEFFKEKEKKENSKIEKYIFINGIEELEAFNQALAIGKGIYDSFKERNINIFMGSLYKKEIYPYKKLIGIGLASGFSRRMGRDKLLIKYKEKTLMEHLINRLEEVNFYKKILVSTEKRLDLFKKKISRELIEIKNENPELGQSQSIKLGVRATEKFNGDGFMFFTGDQPFLKNETILRLIMEFFKTSKITLPCYGNKSFSPVIFPDVYRKRLGEIQGDKGGKSILNSKDEICKISFENSEDFIDIDCQEDLQYLK